MTRFQPPALTKEEEWICQETKRTGNLNLFSNYFFQLPNFGTRWRPNEDNTGHYRHIFGYEQLFDTWARAGKPDSHIEVVANDVPWRIQVDWNGPDTEFLLKHGFIFPNWILPVVSPSMDAALVITGTGTGKTAGAAISSLIYCVLYPGFEYSNIAPSEKQAQLILAELDKWAAEGSPYRRFVRVTSRNKPYTLKPYAISTIISPFGPQYPSHFSCQTIGEKSADQILGESRDRYSIDECQLVDDLSAIIPKAVTRSRGQRPGGGDRWTSLILMTNPPDDPARMANLDQAKKKIEEIQRNPTRYGARLNAIYLEDVHSGENLYITKKQKAYHMAMLDAADQGRYLMGSTETHAYTGEIPTKLITDCVDPVLDEDIRLNPKPEYKVVGREGMGIIRYELPREEDHFYLVSGDPGKNNAIKIDFNNVPVVTVFDVTHFLQEPAKLVYFAMLDGQGDYKPWLNSFRYACMKYQARGYYDATNQPGFEAAGAFNNSLDFEYDGRIIRSPATFWTTEITLANNNKRAARTLFTLLAQDGQFAWPRLETLIHQAAKYAESGTGVKSLPDDIIASIFIYCMALRVEGTLWDKIKDRYYMPEFNEEKAALMERESMPIGINRTAARGTLIRPNRGRR
jgi:hypothetical protein